jgi:hypothetical protein
MPSNLAQELGDLPLALVEQAGALQAETDMSVDEYLRLLKEQTSELLALSSKARLNNLGPVPPGLGRRVALGQRAGRRSAAQTGLVSGGDGAPAELPSTTIGTTRAGRRALFSATIPGRL